MKPGIMTRRKKIRDDAGTPVIGFREDANSQDECAKVQNEDQRNQSRKHDSARYISGKEIEQTSPSHFLDHREKICAISEIPESLNITHIHFKLAETSERPKASPS